MSLGDLSPIERGGKQARAEILPNISREFGKPLERSGEFASGV
jgi:hypothetical protein